jgi:hypothetical protein
MTLSPTTKPEQAVPDAESFVEAELSPEEIAHRTAGGVARWLLGSVLAFWLAVIGVVVSMLRDLPVVQVISLTMLFVTLITSVILYFSVMLEPAIFADRRVKLALGFSFGDLGILTLIYIFAKLYLHSGGVHFSPLTALALVALSAAAAVLAYAFHANRRFLFLLALAILLASNLVPMGR